MPWRRPADDGGTGKPRRAPKSLPAADAAAMSAYAGQLMTTGAQAKTYADHFIAVHLKEIGGGKTYSQLSAESQAQPNNADLKAGVDTLFQDNTLRGLLLLLNAYAFWQMGQIALIASIVSLAAGAIMLILAGLGFWHSRCTPAEAQLPVGGSPAAVMNRTLAACAGAP
jgi:hypothetical protein